MIELTPQQVIERFRKAKDRRSTWESHWRECYDYALPQRGSTDDSSAPGAKRTDKIFDGTAPDAVDQLAASLLAELTPPWSRWFGLSVGCEVSDEERNVLAPELEKAENILQSNFDQSNFAVEMMLEPVNIADGRLDPEKIRIYRDELKYHEGNGEAVLTLADRRLVSATCFWDPAYGSPGKGDANVIAAVFTDERGEYWLHRVRYLEHDPARNEEVDEATQLCRQVVAFVEEHHLPAVTLETNGLGRFLPGLLRQQLARSGLRCAVVENNSRRNKDLRIVEAFDAVLAAGRLHGHQSIFHTELINEMREWRPGFNMRDDGLDAVSGCLLAEPVRLPRVPPQDSREPKQLGKWRGTEAGFRAETEFSA
ncbi:MAG: portal protein [Rhodospirillales bacterium]|nr:portal protein [Rhodospirillales bacterium]